MGILVFPFVLFTIPIEIEYSYDSQSSLKSKTRIVWLFGCVRFQPNPRREEHRGKGELYPKQRASKKTVKADKKEFNVLFAIIRSEGFAWHLFRLFYAILGSTHIKQLRARLLLGFDDPADTGFIHGLLMPGFAFLYAIPKIDFIATPIFDRPILQTELHMKIRLVPIHYLKALVVFVFSLKTFCAAKAAYKAYQL